MINYINEIVDIAKLPIGETKDIVSISLVGGKALVVNNYIKILTYSTSHIVLKVKNDELVIDGSNIIIKQLDKKDLCLVGSIVRVYFANEVKMYEKDKQ